MSDESLITEFLEEASESLTALDEQIVALLTSQDLAKDVNNIFRPVHSIKGAASFFKLTALTAMAHKLETVLDRLRQFELDMSEEVSETLSRGFYMLRNLVDRAMGGERDLSSDDEQFLEELDALLDGDDQPEKLLGDLNKTLESLGGSIPKDLEGKLKKALGIEEDLTENPLQDIVDLIGLQITTPTPETVASIREKVDEQIKNCSDGHEALAPLNAFLEDFNALVDSPVGLDEMMAEVVLDHLDQASKLVPVLKGQETEKPVTATDQQVVEAKKADAPAPSKEKKSSGSIRVNVALLEDIMNLMSELVLTRNELNVHAASIDHPALGKTTQQVSIIMTELQSKVMKTRLQPVSTVFNPLPGVVKDISKTLGKDVDLILEGKDTELDRGVLEGIKDPLTHILRNSLDHGFEMPEERLAAGKPVRCKLSIKAFHEGGQVVIEIKDDGRGVNGAKVAEKAVEKGLFTQQELNAMSEAQKAEIIFHPGFSTADAVSQVSGRGVGMDVVKSNIVALGGQVELDTKVGRGTTLRLKIPLTLAIVPALIVGANGCSYAIPQVSLVEMILLKQDEVHQIEVVRGVEVFRLRGEILPVLRLNRILEVSENQVSEGLNLVILSSGGKTFCLIVERLFDIEEIVVKSLDDLNATNKFFSGATILGDGSIALIFDLMHMSEVSGMVASQGGSMSDDIEEGAEADAEDQVLMFSLGKGDRIFGVTMKSVNRLELIDSKKIDHMNGRFFLRYRKSILPLASAWAFLGLNMDGGKFSEKLHVVVFGEPGREVGLLVQDIVDVVPMSKPLVSDINMEPYYRGSTILHNKIVTMVNLDYISVSLLGDRRSKDRESVLLWESSPEMSAKAMDLRSEGYTVTEVHSREEVEEVIRNVDVDVVLSEDAIGKEDRDILNERLMEKYGDEKRVSLVSLPDEGGWQSELDSEQLSDVIENILNAQLRS